MFLLISVCVTLDMQDRFCLSFTSERDWWIDLDDMADMRIDLRLCIPLVLPSIDVFRTAFFPSLSVMMEGEADG
jgi:hypothetical protein